MHEQIKMREAIIKAVAHSARGAVMKQRVRGVTVTQKRFSSLSQATSTHIFKRLDLWGPLPWSELHCAKWCDPALAWKLHV